MCVDKEVNLFVIHNTTRSYMHIEKVEGNELLGNAHTIRSIVKCNYLQK